MTHTPEDKAVLDLDANLRQHVLDCLKAGAEPDNIAMTLISGAIGTMVAFAPNEIDLNTFQNLVLKLHGEIEMTLADHGEVH